jgi:hypothetical protein
MVHVVNVRVVGPDCVEYVGRRAGGFQGSVLGNPFKLSRHPSPAERLEVITQYRQWLDQQCEAKGSVWQELTRLVRRYRRDGQLMLGCWCAPLPCHAEVIRETILALVNKGDLQNASSNL